MSPNIERVHEFDTGLDDRLMRFVCFENAGRTGLIIVHADTPGQQPSPPNFRWPKDTLKISAFTLEGEHLWQHDVGKGIIPGLWYCPVFPFDLDGDGRDEIYHIGNPQPDRPLDKDSMQVTGLSSDTGEVFGAADLPWFPGNQTMSDTFRYLINGGYSNGKPRLIGAQGCYHELVIGAWGPNLEPLWDRHIPDSEPGCRASHMFPVVDIDGDGRDEVFLGERCIDIDTGEDRWVADRDNYHGHSDIVMPTLDRETGEWFLYTTREFPWPEGSRGVVMFDSRGEEVWGHRGMGHMHSGWTARLRDDGSHLCFAMEVVKHKTGSQVTSVDSECYLYDMTGQQLKVPFTLEGTQPVDIDGDGRHELLYVDGFAFRGKTTDLPGLVIDRHGEEVGRVEGRAAFCHKIPDLNCPGEQILTHDDSGKVCIYGCPDAEDTEEARARYAHPYYKSCNRVRAVGYNWRNHGGL